MATISFYAEIQSENQSLIYLRVNNGKKRTLISTGEKIPSRLWDTSKQRVKTSTTFPRASTLNGWLGNLQEYAEGVLFDLKKNHKGIHFSQLKTIIKKWISGELENIPFWNVFDQFVTEKSGEVKPQTLKKYDTLKNLLEGFQKKKRIQLDFGSFDPSFEIKFKRYLQDEKKQLNDTITKYFECLKTFLRWSNERDFHESKDFEKYSTKRAKDKGDIIVLNELELRTLERQDLRSNDKLRKIRDSFVYQCYTGQRWGDIRNLKWNDIVKTNDGYEWHLYQVKGNKEKRLEIPLFNSAIKILKQYGDFDQSDSYVFPRISSQKTNDYIKDLCKLAEIDSPIKIVRYRGKERIEIKGEKHEFISTHTARRTFVTLSLHKGLAPELVMSITGHEDYRTMKRYMTVFKEVRDREAKKVWNRSIKMKKSS